MRILNAGNMRQKEALRPNGAYYVVETPRGNIILIDKENNFIDLYRQTALGYTIEEAEDLVSTFKGLFPDYANDPYYRQGSPIHPVYQSTRSLPEVEKYKNNNLTLYRYKMSGEWIYGITNKWTDEKLSHHYPRRAIEAPMDGWEKWLKDRTLMLKDKHLAEGLGNL